MVNNLAAFFHGDKQGLEITEFVCVATQSTAAPAANLTRPIV
jgi:hypothetical protein